MYTKVSQIANSIYRIQFADTIYIIGKITLGLTLWTIENKVLNQGNQIEIQMFLIYKHNLQSKKIQKQHPIDLKGRNRSQTKPWTIEINPYKFFHQKGIKGKIRPRSDLSFKRTPKKTIPQNRTNKIYKKGKKNRSHRIQMDRNKRSIWFLIAIS